MDIGTFLIAAGTLLAAIVGVGGYMHKRAKEKLQAIGLPTGGILVDNPADYAVVIHRLTTTRGTLWAEMAVDDLGRARWGDSGKTILECNWVVQPKGRAHFHHCIFYQGETWWPYVTSRRLKWFHPEHVDLILSPGRPVSETEEEAQPSDA